MGVSSGASRWFLRAGNDLLTGSGEAEAIAAQACRAIDRVAMGLTRWNALGLGSEHQVRRLRNGPGGDSRAKVSESV